MEVPFLAKVELLFSEYLLWRKQAMLKHLLEGTHKLLEPVSKTTLKVWAGEPIPTSP
jgi:hypothetical protein